MTPTNQLYSASMEAEVSQSKRRSKMSGDKLQRKRASDREAQRNLREKTRSHVAHLESLVQSLRGEQEGRVERLLAQLDEQRSEITKLKTALTSISKISEGARSTRELSAPQSESQRQPSPDIADAVILTASPSGGGDIDPQYTALPLDTMDACETPGMLNTLPVLDLQIANLDIIEANIDPFIEPLDQMIAGDSISDGLNNLQSMSIAQMASSIVRKQDLDGRLWFLAGTLLSYILKSQDGHPIHTAYDEDIPIRAVFDGWSAVIERYPLDRGWQWLKELDENIYFNLSAQHRLMHLRNCRLQLLHQLYPLAGWDRALPSFFAPRPCQLHIEHDPLIEHFPWPGFRERILFSPRKFATNHFMEALRRNVRFVWPFDSHDLFIKSPTTGLYSYSDTLNSHLTDLRCYTAEADFFHQFPELRQDIPQHGMPLVPLPSSFGAEEDSPDGGDEGSTRHKITTILTV